MYGPMLYEPRIRASTNESRVLEIQGLHDMEKYKYTNNKSSMSKNKGIYTYRDGHNVFDDLNSHAPSCSLVTSNSPNVALQCVTRPVRFPQS